MLYHFFFSHKNIFFWNFNLRNFIMLWSFFILLALELSMCIFFHSMNIDVSFTFFFFFLMTFRDYLPNTVLRYHWCGLPDLFLSDLLTDLNNDVGHMRSVWCLLIVFPKTDMPYGSFSVFVSPIMTALFLGIRQLSSKIILHYVV